MLVVDDGSTDGSAGADRRGWPRRSRGCGRSGAATNGGAAAARNDGIAAARGRLVAFLDADDLWYPEKLARQVAHLRATGAGLVFSAYRRIDAAGRPLGRVGVPARHRPGRAAQGQCHRLPDRGLRHARSTAGWRCRRCGGGRITGSGSTLLARGGAAAGLDEVLADYRVRRGSLSADRLAAAAATWRLYREAAGLSRPRAA